MNNAMKQFDLAIRMYLADNNDKFPGNIDQIKIYLTGTNFPGNIGLDTFEFFQIGNSTMPNRIISRERIPRQTPDGKWERNYGKADGSVDNEISDDGNFDGLEKQWRDVAPNQ